MKTEILNKSSLKRAAELLKQGELVAFPTETVYGLGAPLFLEKGIQKIFEVKGRPQDNPLIAHISELQEVELLALDPPETFFKLAEALFPGPLTLVVKKCCTVPASATAGLDTIGIRMPGNELARSLIKEVGEPLVAPSANLSGMPSSTRLEHVLSDFDGKIAAVLDGGPCRHGIESTVLDLVTFERPTLLRPGGVSKAMLEKVLGMPIDLYTKGPKSSPGMKYRHYAPNIPVYLVTNAQDVRVEENTYLITVLEARSLYDHLRFAEEHGYDEVVIFCDQKIDEALQNRLERILYASSCHR